MAFDILDTYDFDDPFRPDEPDAAPAPDALGLDEEVSVARKRAPAVKLDEARLLSARGLPRLRRQAAGLRLQGKGHEFADAAALLAWYQLWLDDLFPKACFRDALAMVEKVGHRRAVVEARLGWLAGDSAANEGGAAKTQARPHTPLRRAGAVPEENLFDATPPRPAAPAAAAVAGGCDELDAFMAEVERDGMEVDEPPAAHASARPARAVEPDFWAEEEAMREMEGS